MSIKSSHSPSCVVYRLGKSMVYVKPAQSYERAIDLVKQEFHHQTKDVHQSRISLSVLVNTPEKTQRLVRISESAWVAVVNNLKTYEIIDIFITPSVVVVDVDASPAHNDVTPAPLPAPKPTKPRQPSTSRRVMTINGKPLQPWHKLK